MKTTTFKKRLEKQNLNKNTSAYKLLNNLTSNVIRPCWHSGSGRFTTNLDYTTQVMDILKKMHVPFEFGNNSPRGGKTGNFTKLYTLEF